MARALLLLLATACASTAPKAESLPPGVDGWTALTKLAYFPVQLAIEVDGAPITPESLAAVQRSVQGDFERALENENFGARAFCALSQPWQFGAASLGHWLEATPCFNRTAPAEMGLGALLSPLRADAAVYVAIDARVSRDGISSGPTALGKLAGSLGVATLANVVALRAATDGSPFAELAVADTGAQLVARDLEAQRYSVLCADHVDLQLHEEPGVRSIGDAEVTLAVVAADNQLLWFRRGRMPLVFGDPSRAAQVVATLVRASK